LDNRRLGKQRVEAYQILTILEDYLYVGKQLNLPFPEDTIDYLNLMNQDILLDEIKLFKKRCEWLDEVLKKYKNHSEYFLTKDGKYFKCKKINKKILKEKGYRILLGGFSNHPIVKMWVGYTDALKLYINASIKEWLSRGYKNTMKIYTFNDRLKYLMIRPPWWFESKKFHNNHKLSLLLKERDRKEKPFYWNNKNFTENYSDGDFEYIWVHKLSMEDSIKLFL
jgi:hypothetical protein